MNRPHSGSALAVYLGAFLALLSGMAALTPRAQAATNSAAIIYSTGFEVSEGYQPGLSLAGQQGWIIEGTGGNGLVTNFFNGQGQQAYVGFVKPTVTNTQTVTVWRPINLAPITPDRSLVTFSVEMEIVDSNNSQFDDFRWSIYNTNGVRLLSVDFDNSTFAVSYALDTPTFVNTGFTFSHGGSYTLVVTMNFARNLWSATLNNSVIVNGKPLTTTGAALNFGDADAVWDIRTPATPGDNYMLFDNYKITAEPAVSIKPHLTPIGLVSPGQFLLRLNGEPNTTYVVEASENLNLWTTLRSVISNDGVSDVLDTDARFFGSRLYRARVSLP